MSEAHECYVHEIPRACTHQAEGGGGFGEAQCDAERRENGTTGAPILFLFVFAGHEVDVPEDEHAVHEREVVLQHTLHHAHGGDEQRVGAHLDATMSVCGCQGVDDR